MKHVIELAKASPWPSLASREGSTVTVVDGIILAPEKLSVYLQTKPQYQKELCLLVLCAPTISLVWISICTFLAISQLIVYASLPSPGLRGSPDRGRVFCIISP